MKHKAISTVLISSIAFAPMMGCDELPGGPKEQGAVIGGVGGAAAGAAVAKDNRGLGALIGGLLGAGGGYLIGTQVDKKDKEEARQAGERAQQNPATAAQARQSSNADMNQDGFVTLDEVVAMEDAGLSDDEMLRRLRATDQVFQLTSTQEQYLTQRGVSRDVVDQLRTLNQDKYAQTAADRGYEDQMGSEPISRDPAE